MEEPGGRPQDIEQKPNLTYPSKSTKLFFLKSQHLSISISIMP